MGFNIKDLATSLTSLIFVVSSIAVLSVYLLNSPSGVSHPKIEGIKSVLNDPIDNPFIILGNNILIVKETKKEILG